MIQITPKLIERLADLEHERWAGWMRYLFTKGTLNEDGSFTIDPKSVARWQEQVATSYTLLPDHSKCSDRIEVIKTLNIIVCNHG